MKPKKKRKMEPPATTTQEDSSSITVEQHSVVNYALSPEIMGIIRQSIDIHLRSNPNLIKGALLDLSKKDPNFVKEILNQTYLITEEELPVKPMSRDQATETINEYIKNHPGCKTSDIIENLKLDPIFVLEILKELKAEGSVLSKPVE